MLLRSHSMGGAPIPRPTKKPPCGGFWYRRRGEPARSDYFLAAASAAALAASAAALAASPAALAASAAAPATVPAAVPTAAPAAEAASVTAAAAGAGASAGAGAATGAGAGAGAGSSFLPQAARAAAATRAASTSDLFISDFLDGRTKHLGMPQRPIAQCCGRAAPQRFFDSDEDYIEYSSIPTNTKNPLFVRKRQDVAILHCGPEAAALSSRLLKYHPPTPALSEFQRFG